MEADAARRRHLEQRRECVGRQLLADDLVFVFDAAGWHTALGASEARDLVAYIAASRGRILPTSPSTIDLLLK